MLKKKLLPQLVTAVREIQAERDELRDELRDWFAGQALRAAVSDYTLSCRSGNAHGKPMLPAFSDTDNGQATAVANTAYALADAMLKALEAE